MSQAERDVIDVLNEARQRATELSTQRGAYAASISSRLGRLALTYKAAKALLTRSANVVALPAQTIPPTEFPPPSARGDEPARSFLIRRALDEMRLLNRSLAAERDASFALAVEARARVAKAEFALETIRNERDAGRRDLVSARADMETIRHSLHLARLAEEQLLAERKADRSDIVNLRTTVHALQILLNERENRPSSTVQAVIETPPEREPTAQHARVGDLFSAAGEVLNAAHPDVSVIIPAYNQGEMTLNCLESIAEALSDGTTMQLIVIDDASPDDTLSAVAGLPYVTYLRNGSNLGFLRSCNRASLLATGRYLHFLNNDTLVRAGWLRELVVCADGDSTIGAVGSKLLSADGTLQEAGGIIWSDASGWNYGRGDDPEDPKYNYVRDVDYCSGASLLVRSDVFGKLGRFDEAYAPAYFEDSDLCFAIRELGMRVVYQPKSVVVHLEGMSSGKSTDVGIKRHQVLNKPTFVAKWASALERHCEPGSVSGMQAARRLEGAKRLVMIDNYVPEYDKDSGSNKLFNFIKLYQELGYSVVYVPDNFRRSEPYTTTLQNLGIEVLYNGGPASGVAIRERLEMADVVWVGRPELGAKYRSMVREFPTVPLLYDSHDLHYVRLQRELDLKGVRDPQAWQNWERERDFELDVVRSADVAMTVTDVEKRVLEAAGLDNVFVMPNVHELYGRTTTFDDTSGIIFIGGYTHPPNVDAVVWLCQAIMPIVWQTHPHMTVTLIGSNVPESVRDLASAEVRVAGFVPDVTELFREARLMVAPLRFGAGLKGKIGHAFAYGLPTVTTTIGAEGFDLARGTDALVEDEAEAFARAIVRAYDDRALWQTLSTNCMRIVERFSLAATRERLAAAVAFGHRQRALANAAP